jgi:hypothetical protein
VLLVVVGVVVVGVDGTVAYVAFVVGTPLGKRTSNPGTPELEPMPDVLITRHRSIASPAPPPIPGNLYRNRKDGA